MNAEASVNKDVDTGNSTTLPKLGYSVKEAEKITGLGRTTLWKAIDNGRLKCFRVGRRVLFSEDHLQSFLKSYEQPSAHKSR
jgi:excisionase family DNA binding protein